MKSFTSLLVALFLATGVSAFSSSSFTGSSLVTASASSNNKGSMTMEYIPSGMSKAQWEKIKAKDKAKTEGKDLGKVGITTFKSRSFADWQKSGGKNLFPVDPTKVKNPKDIPYMQRPGGMPDDSDLKKPNLFGNMFGGGGGKKTKEEKPAPEAKGTNWWTLK